MRRINYIIFENVHIGKNPTIEDYVVLGKPPRERKHGELGLYIGDFPIIRTQTIIYAGNVIGHHFQTGDGARIRENNRIGNYVSIGARSVVETDCIIEDDVRIHTNCYIAEFTKLEKEVWIGPAVVTTSSLHPPCPKSDERKWKCVTGPTIKRRAKIGAQVTILPGIVIGENSLVGAGSIVTKDIPPNSVVQGNPAKMIKKIDELVCEIGAFQKVYEWQEKWKKGKDGKWERK